ncbi:hypothetical protein M5X06_22120 [Paenibacillus alvei]|uniref:Uncharacterized protein n=1 Tax=Paenibacillus alvei TaxID=44250 RepID=A0ABT4H2L8_PAEAL|nr:hypothetical protein [Paenibacillus alvei]MCY9763225.1 hypothetical protein [Paenibacillus alvei]MCY9769486.1 hypothetical protein [Paenibacillus alvei]
MKQILFMGACEKSDLLIYISKILSAASLKVLLVDATLSQRYFYHIPTIDRETKLTEYDGFDVVRGCNSLSELTEYFSKKDEELNDYQFVLIDSDNPDNVAGWGELYKQFIVSNFERYTVENNISLADSFFENKEKQLVEFELIIHPSIDCNLDSNYPTATLDHLPIAWGEETFEFLYEEQDYGVKVNNQHENRVTLRKLSRYMKKQLMMISQIISGLPYGDIKAAFRLAERGK